MAAIRNRVALKSVRTRTQEVHFQCKACNSFLGSTKNWDRHIKKCRKRQTSVGDLSTPPRFGLFLVRFNKPSIELERVNVEEKLEYIRSGRYRNDMKKGGRDQKSQSSSLAMERLRKQLGIEEDDEKSGYLDQPVLPRRSFKAAKNKLQEINSNPRVKSPEEKKRKVMVGVGATGKAGKNIPKKYKSVK